jgi:hypothetical protein
MNDFQLTRNEHGRLVLRTADRQETYEGVVPVRAFPIAAPEAGISLVSADGKELAWFDSLATMPPEMRKLIEEELSSREFLPEIHRIIHVSSFATPSTWEVETSHGKTNFVLRGEEDIRRVAANTLLIADTYGIQFLIRDQQKLDKTSRKLLDRFL